MESPISEIIGVSEEKTSKRKVSLEIIEDISETTARNSPPEKGLLQTQHHGLAKPKHILVKLALWCIKKNGVRPSGRESKCLEGLGSQVVVTSAVKLN